MSIVDSKEDLEAAQARVSGSDESTLVADLAFWSIAQADARADYVTAAEQQSAATRRYQEAERWSTLIGEELRERREKRVGRTPVSDD